MAIDARRVDRALTEHIYLISNANPDEYIVMGSAGYPYEVHVDTTKQLAMCTCPDCEHNGAVCKHILYVLFRVLHSPVVRSGSLAGVIANAQPRPRVLPPVVSESDVLNRVWNGYRLAGFDWVQPRWEEGDECPICFEPLVPDREYVHWCRRQCGKCLHRACFAHVIAKDKCPMCRGVWG